ncbi:MAG TPA: Gfo/Idh/MocA family oxidoreductase [Candidatus Saccharimonadales bacterium]|nr:Gfo/Idh/MocA family oxidoreductase [Candidatus Saccharimonadales bacterium]
MTKRVRVGVLGAGSWANAVHLPALAKRDDVELVVVSRRDGDLACQIAERFGVEHATTDWQEALRYGLDAVIVASPPSVHLQQVTAALESGAHVLAEKPFAITSEDAWRMVDASRRTGRTLLIAFGWNHMPLIQGARRLMDERRIGAIEFLTLEIRVAVRELLMNGTGYRNPASDVLPPRPETFVRPDVSGGGQAPVTMSHAFGVALFLSRLDAASVYAQLWNGPIGVDVHDAMIVTFENGAIGAINGASSHESKPNVEWEIAVFGTGGQLQLDSVTADVHFGSADGNIYRADLPPNAGVYEPTGPLRTLISVAQGGLAGDESPAELGARTVELVEASFRSARSGRAESVPSPARPACEGAMPAGPGRGR